MFASLETAQEPEPWEKLIADETLSYPFSCAVRGALEAYDWTDLIPLARGGAF